MDQTDHQQLNSLEFRNPFYRLEPSGSANYTGAVLISFLSPLSRSAGTRGWRGVGKTVSCKQVVQANKLHCGGRAGPETT